MRARLALGLVVTLAVAALAGWRLESLKAGETGKKSPPHAAHMAAAPPSPIGSADPASISPSAARSRSPAAPGLPPALSGTGWRLAFSAAFSGSSLDSALWQTCYPFAGDQAGCTNYGNKEYEWYQPSQVQVGDGALSLTASREPTAGQDQAGDPEDFACRSGMVTTAGSFNFRYGYVQVEARIAMGAGLWPALWLAASNLEWPPEIDILEHWDSYSYYGIYLHTIKQTTIGHRVNVAGWHTFAVSWQPGRLTWYLDNRPVFTTTQYVPQQDMYFIANVAESTAPTATRGCEGSMLIRSVKIWQHS
jgi:hypothetical protein